MAQSSGRVAAGSLTPGTFQHDSSGTTYRITSDGAVNVANKATKGNDWKLDYFVGSGASGQSFLFAISGFLFQAPVTWYSRLARWDVSPGYENDTNSRWNRVIEPECLSCHSSQVRAAADYQNLYAEPPFAQSGIGCERCHGPGSEHIAGRMKLVDPAALEPAKRDSVCAQCHMAGEARIPRAGTNILSYRPGDLISRYAAYFVYAGPSALKATSYVEKLASSRCKLASGDRLWCGTCHDPHQVPTAQDRVAWYQAKCQACHTVKECARGPDCAQCHMPKGTVQDVTHGVLSDHAIPRIPQTGGRARNEWRLRPFSPADAGERELGLAYAEVFLRTRDPRQEAEAFRLLGPLRGDKEADLRLAAIYQHRGDTARAIEIYTSVLKSDPSSVIALVNLGNALASLRDYNKAIGSWRRALTRNPCQAESVANLRSVYQAMGDTRNLALLRQSQVRCLAGAE